MAAAVRGQPNTSPSPWPRRSLGVIRDAVCRHVLARSCPCGNACGSKEHGGDIDELDFTSVRPSSSRARLSEEEFANGPSRYAAGSAGFRRSGGNEGVQALSTIELCHKRQRLYFKQFLRCQLYPPAFRVGVKLVCWIWNCQTGHPRKAPSEYAARGRSLMDTMGPRTARLEGERPEATPSR